MAHYSLRWLMRQRIKTATLENDRDEFSDSAVVECLWECFEKTGFWNIRLLTVLNMKSNS